MTAGFMAALFSNQFFAYLGEQSWDIALVLFVTLVATLLARRILSYLKRSPSANSWLKALGMGGERIVPWLILAYGLFGVLFLIFKSKAIPYSADVVVMLRQAFAVAGITWLLFRWKAEVEKILDSSLIEKGSEKSQQALIIAIGKIASIIIVLIAALMILDIFGVPIAGFLAFGGVGALAVSFAASSVIANFFGGFMIYMNRHFTVGDWIMSPNKNFEGVVEEIGWYMTRIRTFARRPMFIPNAQITDAIVENPSRMYNRRIKENIGVRYDDVKQVKSITEAIEEMLRNHPEIDQNQHLMVDFVAFGPSSLDINVYTFTKTTNWKAYRNIQQDVFLRIADIIEGHGAQIAFPTRTLHLHQEEQETS